MINLLIVDDLVANIIKFNISPIVNKLNIFDGVNYLLATTPYEADEFYKKFDIDIAIVDIDLQCAISGISLPIVTDNYKSLKKNNVILILSDKFETKDPELKSLLSGCSKESFLGVEIVMKSFFKTAIETLIKLGKVVSINYKGNTLFKVSDILLITTKDKIMHIYLSNKNVFINIDETSVGDLFERIKGFKLIQINQNTIVNTDYFKLQYLTDENFEFAIGNGVNLKVTDNYKNLLKGV